MLLPLKSEKEFVFAIPFSKFKCIKKINKKNTGKRNLLTVIASYNSLIHSLALVIASFLVRHNFSEGGNAPNFSADKKNDSQRAGKRITSLLYCYLVYFASCFSKIAI